SRRTGTHHARRTAAAGGLSAIVYIGRPLPPSATALEKPSGPGILSVPDSAKAGSVWIAGLAQW
ncbi:MAG TPA: hypothetical protein VF796_30160, partial [Humisphaera sp.]